MASPRVIWAALVLALAVCAHAASYEVQDFTLVVKSKGGQPEAYTASPPAAIEQQLALATSDELEVTFSVALAGSEARPPQAVLRLTHTATGASAHFAATKDAEGGLHARATPAAVRKQVGQLGGAFEAALVLAGDEGASPLEWRVASLDLPRAPGAPPAARWAPLPEIAHAHRPPVRQVAAPVALVFTLGVLAPLAAWLALLPRIGGNLKGFPSGTGALAATLFHAGLASILGLFLLFWVRLSLAQTAPLAAALGLATSAAWRLAQPALRGAGAAAPPAKKQQ